MWPSFEPTFAQTLAKAVDGRGSGSNAHAVLGGTPELGALGLPRQGKRSHATVILRARTAFESRFEPGENKTPNRCGVRLEGRAAYNLCGPDNGALERIAQRQYALRRHSSFVSEAGRSGVSCAPQVGFRMPIRY
ncbi:unnamed protein product, partial [Iphiclides podalirius]